MYLEQLQQELEALEKIVPISPFAAILASGALIESVTYDVFHFEEPPEVSFAPLPWAPDERVTFYKLIEALYEHNIIPYNVNGIMHKLRIETNDCRHGGWRPTEEEATKARLGAAEVLSYFSRLVYTIPCRKCNKTNRVKVSEYLSQPTRENRARCGDQSCKNDLRIRKLQDLERVKLESPKFFS